MYDYIVVGAGSSGCVMAARLSENPLNNVLLLESGSNDNSLLINTPAGLAANVIFRNKNNWAYETVPQSGLNGRRGYQPRGKVLGGSSSINAMIYTRGHPKDYDDWEKLGNKGWGWKDVLPYFLKSQNQERGKSLLHGVGGPLNVMDLRTPNPVAEAFVNTAINQGYKHNDDFNGEDQEGVGFYQVTQKNGKRHSASRAYLDAARNRKNLTVLTKAHALEITFDGFRATGIRCQHEGTEKTFTVSQEVILSSGAFGSPQLLMLSGLGPAEELQKHGIRVRLNAPGVGQNLRDHVDYVFAYRSESKDTFGLSVGGVTRLLKEINRYRKHHDGMISSNIAEAGGFLKTTPSMERPDIQLHLVVGLLDDHGRKMHMGHGYSCHVCLLRPKSVGQLTLNSRNPLDAPAIDPAFFTHPDDIELMKTAYRQTEAILESDDLASLRGESLYSIDSSDDQTLEALLRQRSDTIYHPIGTCRMGSDREAVVDHELRVKGVEGLRVVDASIMPTLIGGNTNTPSIMIAEKAADMIVMYSHH